MILTPAEFAIANKCRTALVDPPKAITTVIAFSSDFLFIMSLGLISFLTQAIKALAESLQSIFLELDIATCAELFVKLIPKASIAHAIVFAVYMPPHDPGPGIAFFSIAYNSELEISLFAFFPTASNTETISIFLDL